MSSWFVCFDAWINVFFPVYVLWVSACLEMCL